MRQERGFTLIELLIVLAIMGILVGIVAMSVGDLTDTATRRSMSSEWETVRTAIDTYNTQQVAVEGEAELAAHGDTAPAQIDADTVEFGQYLRRDTNYYYTWSAGGEDLTVYEDADATSLGFNASGWINE